MLFPPTTYYHRINKKTTQRAVSGGRPIPGYSYTVNGDKIDDELIKQWLLQLIENEGYAYGYYKLTIILRRKTDLIINKKKVYRLCKELGILCPQREVKTKHPRRLARNRTITGSNQLWETDLKYGFITGENRFFFIQSIIDVYDRSIVGYHIGPKCTGQDAAWVLEDDCLARHEFESYEDAYRVVTVFMRFYNEQRIHSSIDYLAPSDFYSEHIANGLTTREVRV